MMPANTPLMPKLVNLVSERDRGGKIKLKQLWFIPIKTSSLKIAKAFKKLHTTMLYVN